MLMVVLKKRFLRYYAISLTCVSIGRKRTVSNTLSNAFLFFLFVTLEFTPWVHIKFDGTHMNLTNKSEFVASITHSKKCNAVSCLVFCDSRMLHAIVCCCNVLPFAIQGRSHRSGGEQTIMGDFSRPSFSVGCITSRQWDQFCYIFTAFNCCHTLFGPSWKVNLDILFVC